MKKIIVLSILSISFLNNIIAQSGTNSNTSAKALFSFTIYSKTGLELKIDSAKSIVENLVETFFSAININQSNLMNNVYGNSKSKMGQINSKTLYELLEILQIQLDTINQNSYPTRLNRNDNQSIVLNLDNTYNHNIGLNFVSVDSITKESLACWLFYAKILNANLHNNQPDIKERAIMDKELAVRLAEKFNDILINKVAVCPKIDFKIHCMDAQVPSPLFNKIIINDASFLISGEEGKLKQSKASLDFISPSFQFAQPFFIGKEGGGPVSLQAGVNLKMKNELSKIKWDNPNFDFLFNIQGDFILAKSASYKFDYDTCVKCMLQSYHIPSTKSNALDSFRLTFPWNTKKIFWFSVNIIGGGQSVNVFDETKNDTTFRKLHFTGGLTASFNIHHYVNKKYNGTEKAGGNKYFKVGFDMFYANSIDNNGFNSSLIQYIDSNSNAGTQKVKKEVEAFSLSQFNNYRFTFSPFMDFYWMEKTRHFGAHLLFKSKLGIEDSKLFDKAIYWGIGVFFSINNDIFSKFGVSNNTNLNIELLLTSRNFLDPTVTKSKSFGGMFVPSLKFEIPFSLLNK